MFGLLGTHIVPLIRNYSPLRPAAVRSMIGHDNHYNIILLSWIFTGHQECTKCYKFSDNSQNVGPNLYHHIEATP